MLRRLALAILPAVALTATVACAHTRLPVIAGADTPTFRASFDTAHAGRAVASSDLSLDGRAFGGGDEPLASNDSSDRSFPVLQVEGAASTAQGRQDGARAQPARTANASPSKVARLPEPATWAMMIIGFGLIGGAVRRGLRKSDERFNDYIRRITEDADA